MLQQLPSREKFFSQMHENVLRELRSHLLSEWELLGNTLHASMQETTVPMWQLMESVGKQDALSRARCELERLPCLDESGLLMLRDETLQGHFMRAWQQYCAGLVSEAGEAEKTIAYYQQRGRCRAYASIQADLTLCFFLPPQRVTCLSPAFVPVAS